MATWIANLRSVRMLSAAESFMVIGNKFRYIGNW